LEEDGNSRDEVECVSKMAILPKRILDVFQIPNPEVKLVESEDGNPIYGRYICLSHCWGGQRHFRLTSETLPAMKAGLKISKLAKNFQDAILMTRIFEIRYLWIDALCILQDSQIDWELESAKMGQYYKASWLTISAGMSDGGTEGLLAKRSTHGLPHIRLETKSIPNGPSTIYSQKEQEHTIYFALDPIRPSTQCPIRTRGWTFQEEMLPRRYLSFETTQAYLRCGLILHHECGRQEHLLRDRSPFLEGEQLFQSGEWLEIVMRYSSRNLTKASDKLPALSGLAHEYQMRWRDDYLAGLWRKDLWKSLLWRRNEAYSLPEPKRPAEYRAPTWSWASIDGRIEFDIDILDEECQIHINSASTELSGSDPMGQVSGGKIELRAVMVKMDPYGNIPNHLEIELHKIYDVPDEVRPETPMRDQWLLWITRTSGLILRLSLTDTELKMAYERIGYFSSTPSVKLDAFWSRVRWTLSPTASPFYVSSWITLV
jgi:hypothetical protein